MYYYYYYVLSYCHRCLDRFDAYLLEVSLLGFRLGHKDMKSAKEAKDRKSKEVTDLLMYLLADTEVYRYYCQLPLY